MAKNLSPLIVGGASFKKPNKTQASFQFGGKRMFKKLLLPLAVSTAFAAYPALSQQQQQNTPQQAQQGQQQAQQGQQQAQQGQQQAQQGRQQAQSGGQQQSAQGQSLEQMARQQPEQLEGRTVQSREGQALGQVLEIVESKNEGRLFAVVRSTEAQIREEVVPLGSLSLEKVLILSSNQPGQRQRYNEADYVVIVAETENAQLQTQRNQQQGQQGQQQAQRNQQQGQQGQQQAQRNQQQGQQGQQQAQRSQQQSGQSQQSVEQIARSQPNQLIGSSLQSPDGQTLGRIAEIVESKSERQLFAVVRPSDAGASQEELVPLQELRMEEVLVLTDTQNLGMQPYEESDYQAFEVDIERDDRV